MPGPPCEIRKKNTRYAQDKGVTQNIYSGKFLDIIFVFEISVETFNERSQPMTHLRNPLGGSSHRLVLAESGVV